MAHPVVFVYLSTTPERLPIMAFITFIVVPGLGQAGTCLVLSVCKMVSNLLTGWRKDHGPTNVGAMVKSTWNHNKLQEKNLGH